MPILLTTPLDTGDIDAVDYDEVKILEMNWNGEHSNVRVLVQYGNTVSGEWIAGKQFQGPSTQNPCYHVIAGEDYTDLMGTLCSGVDILVYEKVKEALYTHLLNEGLYPGTIV